MKKKREPTLGITGFNIAVHLAMLGADPDEAYAAGLEFSERFGATHLDDREAVMEILTGYSEATRKLLHPDAGMAK